jgi:hypothetical protein
MPLAHSVCGYALAKLYAGKCHLAEVPGVLGIVQIRHQTLINDALANHGIRDWPSQFNTAKHIAIHPIGARQIQAFFLAGTEIKDPRML